MSGIPATPVDIEPSSKRKRTYSSVGENSAPESPEQQLPPPPMSGPYGQPPNLPIQGSPIGHIPKRGSRACTNCRRGKNRCEFEGDQPCRRCQLAGLPCIFEKPEKKPPGASGSVSYGGSNTTMISDSRIGQLESQFMGMQNQMMGVQSTLDRILMALGGGSPSGGVPSIQVNGGHQPQIDPALVGVSGPPGQSQYQQPVGVAPFAQQGGDPNTFRVPPQRVPSSERLGLASASNVGDTGIRRTGTPTSNTRGGSGTGQEFPPLPGFAAPPHKFATYGIVPSTNSSTDDESEDTLPRSSLNAPIEALQDLANAAVEVAAAAAHDPEGGPGSAKLGSHRHRAPAPIPVNAFPHVIDKGLVSAGEARQLFDIFFTGCHMFVPLFDYPAYDDFDGLKARTPFCFDAILAVASRIRAGVKANDAVGLGLDMNLFRPQTYRHALEEAQGIARSTLFGPVVRKEAVMATLLLAAWSANGWLPSGHALRMALDLGLHLALEKLFEGDVKPQSTGGKTTSKRRSDSPKKRSDEEERDLVVSARIWLNLYVFDHQLSLGTGRPIVLRDENSVKQRQLLLSHPLASPTAVRLISQVDLVLLKTRLHDLVISEARPHGAHSAVDEQTLSLVRGAVRDLDAWYEESDRAHANCGMPAEAVTRKSLSSELAYAKLWIICLVLRGAGRWVDNKENEGSNDALTGGTKELAFMAKEAASTCLTTILGSADFRGALRFAVNDVLVAAAFSGLFLLKITGLFPNEIDAITTLSQVEDLASVFDGIAASRYALTLRLMSVNLKRKVGIATGPNDSLLTGAVRGDQDETMDNGETSNTVEASNSNLMARSNSSQQPLPPLRPDNLGFSWPADVDFSIPPWLKETNLGDLGLPANGSEGVFLPMGTSSLWPGDVNQYQAW